ncbi:hypothetical protein RG963_16300, partial [Methanosarcina sp. Z-7115]
FNVIDYSVQQHDYCNNKAKDESLTGNITCDNTSLITVILRNSTTFTGVINTEKIHQAPYL